MLFTAVFEVKKIQEILKISSHSIEEAWQNKFLSSRAGKQFLDGLQKSQQCLIIDGTGNDFAEEKNNELTGSSSAHADVSVLQYFIWSVRVYIQIAKTTYVLEKIGIGRQKFSSFNAMQCNTPPPVILLSFTIQIYELAIIQNNQ